MEGNPWSRCADPLTANRWGVAAAAGPSVAVAGQAGESCHGSAPGAPAAAMQLSCFSSTIHCQCRVPFSFPVPKSLSLSFWFSMCGASFDPQIARASTDIVGRTLRKTKLADGLVLTQVGKTSFFSFSFARDVSSSREFQGLTSVSSIFFFLSFFFFLHLLLSLR